MRVWWPGSHWCENTTTRWEQPLDSSAQQQSNVKSNVQLLDVGVVLKAVKPGSRTRQESVNFHTRVVWLQVLSAECLTSSEPAGLQWSPQTQQLMKRKKIERLTSLWKECHLSTRAYMATAATQPSKLTVRRSCSRGSSSQSSLNFQLTSVLITINLEDQWLL